MDSILRLDYQPSTDHAHRRHQSFRRPRHPPPRRRDRGRLPPPRARPPGPRPTSTGCPSPSASCSRTRCGTPAAASSSEAHVRDLAAWSPTAPSRGEVPFMPARVVLQDFTGVPVRGGPGGDARRHGADGGRPGPDQPGRALRPGHRPLGPGGLTTARTDALQLNVELEFERNLERYQLLKFAQRAFHNFRVVPPGTGIVHQVNLEYLAPVVQLRAAVRRADGLPRHPGRHRFPHHHDQRPGRARLGRGRDRGRSGHAGPALLHADPRGDRHEADGRAAARAPPPPTWCSR